MYNLSKRKQGKVVFAGDSITARGCFDEFFDEESVLNRGIGSDTAEGLYNRVEGIITMSPEKVFIMIGINDISTGCDLGKTVEYLRYTAGAIKKELPHTEIYIESILPSNNKEWEEEIVQLNRTYEVLCDDEGYLYVDIYSKFTIDGELDGSLLIDDVHLSGKGYEVWVDCIRDYIDGAVRP